MTISADEHLLGLCLEDLSNQLAAAQHDSDLNPSEKAQKLIRISREMREISASLRLLSEQRHRHAISPSRSHADPFWNDASAIAAE